MARTCIYIVQLARHIGKKMGLAALACAGIHTARRHIRSTPPATPSAGRGAPHIIRPAPRRAVVGGPYDDTGAVGGKPHAPESVWVAPHHVRLRLVLRGASSRGGLGWGKEGEV